MQKSIPILVLTTLLLSGCAAQNHAQVLTEKCVEDGLKQEACTCIVDLMEEHLTDGDIQDLAKAVQSGDESETNFSNIEDLVRKKLKAQMDELPPLEQIKKVADVGVGLSKCTPKVF